MSDPNSQGTQGKAGEGGASTPSKPTQSQEPASSTPAAPESGRPLPAADPSIANPQTEGAPAVPPPDATLIHEVIKGIPDQPKQRSGG